MLPCGEWRRSGKYLACTLRVHPAILSQYTGRKNQLACGSANLVVQLKRLLCQCLKDVCLNLHLDCSLRQQGHECLRNMFGSRNEFHRESERSVIPLMHSRASRVPQIWILAVIIFPTPAIGLLWDLLVQGQSELNHKIESARKKKTKNPVNGIIGKPMQTNKLSYESVVNVGVC